ncbi:MAG: class I SAM-dependent methyltransferase [Chloroflexi bacterium]|nr:class I SAM-dependent methyltransferase [Chloroflexota bacterium]
MSRPSELRSGDELVRCNLCGCNNAIELFPDTRLASQDDTWEAFRCTSPGYGVHARIVRCQCCGLAYSNPRPSQSHIEANYTDVEDPLYLREREAREATFEHHLRHLERYTGPAQGRRLLDVGAYIGVFVEVAGRHDWDAWGVEPSRWGVEYAQQRGLNMIPATLRSSGLPPESFDVITMWDVIEHVYDPMADLRCAFELLQPGGWLAVHTMDLDSLFAKLMGRRWPWLMEMHIYYFTRKTLRRMLEEAGFEVMRVKPEARYLRIKYLITRLRPYSSRLADWVEKLASLLRIDRWALPVNFGDLVTAYARKPSP